MAVRVETQTPAEGSNRPLDARAANDRIAAKAERLRFHSRVPMLCECATPDCQTLLMVSLAEYEEIRSDPYSLLAAPGHEIDGATFVERRSGYEVHRSSPTRKKNGNNRRSA